MKREIWIVMTLLIVATVTMTLMSVSVADAGKLEEAIAKTPQGIGKGEIDPQAEPGFMGIPGAVKPSWIIGIIWGIWVGWIFSTVGAFGGIMAGVGHISVFGLGDYADSFKNTNSALGKLLTDSIRTSNQYLVGFSGLISSATYYRMGRIVLPLGICLALGSIAAGLLIPYLTAGKIDLKSYQGFFGLTVLVIGGFLLYETTPQGQRRKKDAKAAAEAFEREPIRKAAASANPAEPEIAGGVHLKEFGIRRISFTFYGVEFGFNPILALVGGFVINCISSFIGVGGGFLYVPFLTSIVGLPMYIVAGTSALAVLVGMISSIYGYMFRQGIPVDLVFIGTELIGIFVGSISGPITSKKIPDIWLKRIFVVLALYVGIGYTIKGFWHIAVFPGL
ncbi:MAG: sulfite exporter TauE/SafE family protein [Desulfomonilaceae bacterium]